MKEAKYQFWFCPFPWLPKSDFGSFYKKSYLCKYITHENLTIILSCICQEQLRLFAILIKTFLLLVKIIPAEIFSNHLYFSLWGKDKVPIKNRKITILEASEAYHSMD